MTMIRDPKSIYSPDFSPSEVFGMLVHVLAPYGVTLEWWFTLENIYSI